MLNFDLKRAAIYRAVLLEKIPPFWGSRKLKDVFLFLALLSFALFFVEGRIAINYEYFFEAGLLFFALFILFLEASMFFYNHLSRPRLLFKIEDAPGDANIADYLDLPAARVMGKMGGGADSYLLLYHLLKEKDLDFIFSRSLIDKRDALYNLKNMFRKDDRVRDSSFSLCLQKTIKDALEIAQKRKAKRIGKGDLFASLCLNNDYLRELLYLIDIKVDDIIDLVSWKERLAKEKELFSYDNLLKKGSLGREWSSGYTNLLDDYSVDWTNIIKAAGFPVTIGHEEEMESVERVLSRREMNNVIIVGEPGTGRKSMIRELARRSFLGKTLPEIKHMRVLQLEVSSVLAQSGSMEETEALFDQIFREAAWADNVILVIDEIHNFVGGEKRPGAVNISGVLEPYLHNPNFHLLGVTSFVGFRRQIEDNPSISSLMEKVEVRDISEKETLLLLERMTPSLEKNYRKFISYTAMKRVIDLSARYMPSDPFPEKAMNLLEEVVVHADQRKEYIVTPQHVADVLSEKAEIPVGDVGRKEKQLLLHLEDLMHERIVNQDVAVKEVSSALRRSRAGVSTRKGLIGSFLFLGPTGVGKTETAKAIADIYFKSQRRMIRIDMSEFQSIKDVSRLIGSATEEGVLTHRVRENPFSLVLLDEIEKSHPDVLNIFLQVLDEGHVTDGVGRKVDFRNSMVIATSNAGYQTIIDSVEKEEDWGGVKKKILDRLFRESIFRPEFVNRFDAVVLFEPLSKENLIIISGMQLDRVARDLKDKEIDFVVTDELRKAIVEMSYDPLFGAREMQRIIQDKVGNLVSSAILEEKIGKGDSFSINVDDFSIIKR